MNMTGQVRDSDHVPRWRSNLVEKALTLNLILTGGNLTPIKSPMDHWLINDKKVKAGKDTLSTSF